MTGSRYTRTLTFAVNEAKPPAKEVGIERVLTPILPVELVNIKVGVRFLALVDSGADYSYLPYQAAKLMGIEAGRLAGKKIQNQGIGGIVESKFVQLKVGIVGDDEEVEFWTELPFLVPLKDSDSSDIVLIGRHPFFDDFHIDFRMGFSNDPSFGKWTLREVLGRRDSRRYEVV